MAPSNRGSDDAGDLETVHTAVTDTLNSACSGGTELSWRHYCVMVTIIITHAESMIYPSASKFSAAKAQQGGKDPATGRTFGFQGVIMV